MFRDLAARKLHVAENYTTKSGMKEIKDEILGAVGGLREDLRHLSSRIDTMHEAPDKASVNSACRGIKEAPLA